jgi:hypothetical protein
MTETRAKGCLRFSEAVALLAQGIWGGLKRPAPVVEVKKLYKGQGSVTFGPWKEKAGARLTLAAVDEQIPVYVFGRPQAERGDRRPKLTRVPGAVLRRLIKSRGCLPDHSHAPMKAVAGNGELYRALNTGPACSSEKRVRCVVSARTPERQMALTAQQIEERGQAVTTNRCAKKCCSCTYAGRHDHHCRTSSPACDIGPN